MKELLFAALVLACPLMMILMMRGHRHGGHAPEPGDEPDRYEQERLVESSSTEELRRRRDALDRLIEEREAETVVGAGVEHGGDHTSSR